MGAEEVAWLVAGQQLAMAVHAYLTRIAPSVTSPFAKAAIAVGQQLSANIMVGMAAGLSAASAEFSTTNSQEKNFVSAVSGIPPIT